MVCHLSLSELVYITMKYKEEFVLCHVLFYILVEVREISLCPHLPIFPIKKLATPLGNVLFWFFLPFFF
jgi:hypothetical protein